MKDSYGREIDYLRLAVTDKCNLFCVYCRPEGETPPAHTLSLNEISRILRATAQVGIKKLKITGGEPLVHPQITEIIRSAKTTGQFSDITLTTNGTLLEKLADGLVQAGLDAVNISLDTLDPVRYKKLTGRDMMKSVIAGLDAVLMAGPLSVKINCVATRESSQDDLLALTALASDRDIHVRFIELMPMGRGKTQNGLDPEELMNILSGAFGTLTPCRRQLGNGPADYYSLPGFIGRLGFINAVKSRFCDKCNRLRITADGWLKTCLHMDKGILLPLGDEERMIKEVRAAILAKPASHLFATEDGDRRLMSQIGG
ncbi:MAG: GTP 3',8-cyclase MoaA [Deltaproteobacteria bacterium]|jgi:cyclic pyranopterin phosphate synthase|nr:GTP 3',8-cyclase MoaA [Deltaproteobacteria bacterium]